MDLFLVNSIYIYLCIQNFPSSFDDSRGKLLDKNRGSYAPSKVLVFFIGQCFLIVFQQKISFDALEWRRSLWYEIFE